MGRGGNAGGGWGAHGGASSQDTRAVVVRCGLIHCDADVFLFMEYPFLLSHAFSFMYLVLLYFLLFELEDSCSLQLGAYTCCFNICFTISFLCIRTIIQRKAKTPSKDPTLLYSQSLRKGRALFIDHLRQSSWPVGNSPSLPPPFPPFLSPLACNSRSPLSRPHAPILPSFL